MMKQILSTTSVLLLMGANQGALAASGNLFEVTGTGTAANITITVCLNAKAALSCQKYTVTGETISIRTLIPNHAYPFVGAKSDSPEFTLTGCTSATNGFCVFSTSDTAPQTVTAVPTVAIGSSFGGGKVACLGGGDLNLIAATSDYATPIAWSTQSTDVPAAISPLDGAFNSNRIVDTLTTAGESISSYAAGVCSEYRGGDFSDWFLPALEQLNCLYTNRVAIGNFYTTYDDNPLYWSSTQDQTDDSLANAVYFLDGTTLLPPKNLPFRVRCVRMF